MSLPIALQTYTVREALAKDVERTLQQVADIGYRFVEGAGFGDRTAAQVKDLCDKLSLQVMGVHSSLDQMLNKTDALVSDAKTLGFKYVTCSYLGNEFRTPEGYRQAAAMLNDAGKKFADQGLKVSYHNHAFEFDRLSDGSNGYTILTQETDADTVNFQLDVMWVRWGGEDPVAWMKKLVGRVPLLHIKDTPGPAANGKKFTEVGTGIVDLRAVVNAAPAAASQYLIVEQDSNWIDEDPIKSARISFNNLTKIVAG